MVVILVGICGTLSALLIQGVASALGAEAILGLLMRRVVGVHVWSNALAIFGLILMLLVGHMVQMAVWAIAFIGAGEFAEFTVAFYHSAVNYTTLGYGDVVMSPRWRLLGPLEAASGMLAFGWSTAVIVTVAIRLSRTRHRAQARSSAPSRSTDTRRFS
jgi:Ion channel